MVLLAGVGRIRSASFLVIVVTIPMSVVEFHNIHGVTPVKQIQAIVPTSTEDSKININSVTRLNRCDLLAIESALIGLSRRQSMVT
jgi:hypothetical protein